MLSAVGQDREGADIVRSGQDAGMDTGLMIEDLTARTATYTAFLDSQGDCKFGVGDMDIHSLVSRDYLLSKEVDLSRSQMIICDGNLSEEAVHTLLEICNRHSVPFFYEPADLSKAFKPLTSLNHSSVTYSSPNLNELNAMLLTLPDLPCKIQSISSENIQQQIIQIAENARKLIDHYKIQCLMVTLSEHGVVIVRQGLHNDPLPMKNFLSSKANDTFNSSVSGVWYPCHDPCKEVVSVSGAGDCLTAGFIAAVLSGKDQASAVSAGLQAARLSCGVSAAVPEADILNSNKINWTSPADEIVLF